MTGAAMAMCGEWRFYADLELVLTRVISCFLSRARQAICFRTTGQITHTSLQFTPTYPPPSPLNTTDSRQRERERGREGDRERGREREGQREGEIEKEI